MRARVAMIVAVAIVGAACSSGETPIASVRTGAVIHPPPANLTIYAAASLKGTLEEAKTAYATVVPGTTLTVSTDSSSALETQIEQGAPADVFLSADTTNPKKLVDAGWADGEPVIFATNRLTIIVPPDNPAGIESPGDLAKPGTKIIAAGDDVPITKYATRLVANLAKESGYPVGFEAAYATNVASKEGNVKAIVAKVELGEGDAGIVYVTDAKASTKVSTVDVPDSANVRTSYAGVVIRASKNVEAARAFLAWLAGPDGQAILGGFGFLPPA